MWLLCAGVVAVAVVAAVAWAGCSVNCRGVTVTGMEQKVDKLCLVHLTYVRPTAWHYYSFVAYILVPRL